jgi:hypothetical protein
VLDLLTIHIPRCGLLLRPGNDMNRDMAGLFKDDGPRKGLRLG